MARTNTNSGGGGGGVNSVTASLPLTSSGGANPDIAINQPSPTNVWYSNALGMLAGDNNFIWDSVPRVLYVGDPNGTGNGTLFSLSDTGQTIDINTNQLSFGGPSGTDIFGRINATTQFVAFGDILNSFNNTYFEINDLGSLLKGQVNGLFRIVDLTNNAVIQSNSPTKIVELGDVDSAGNDTLLTVDDTAQVITGNVVLNAITGEMASLDISTIGSKIVYTDGVGGTWGFEGKAGGSTLIYENTNSWTWPSVDSTGTQALVSNGAGTLSWASIAGSGVTTMAPIGATPNADGATISGTTLNLEPASASFGGVVTTGTQTLAGAKTFSSAMEITAANALTLGTASSVDGSLILRSAANAFTTTIKTGVTGASYTLTLPVDDGTSNQVLSTNGSGILSWATPATGTVTGSGTSPRIPYWSSASALTDDASFTRLAGRGILLQDDATFKNVFIGNGTGVTGATGAGNVALGTNALNALTSGTQNTAIGEEAAGNLTDGTHNITIGNMAGENIISSQNSVYLGREAGRNMRADESVGIGYGALRGSGTPASNTGQRNIGIGRSTLESLTSGQNNIAIGYGAGASIANGAENILMGQSTGLNIIATSGNTFIGNSNSSNRTSGNNNTIIGASASGAIATGATNSALGYNAFAVLTSGANNVAVGSGAGGTLTTGSDNTFVGPSAVAAATSTTGAIALGYQASAATNEFAISDSITNFKFQGDSYTLPTAFPSANDKAMVSSTAGVMTWGPVISSGFYTPTLTNVTNISASVAYDAQWMRIGNVVTVGGRVEVDPTAGSTATELGISLPIASDIQGLEGVVGTAFSSTVQQGGAIQGDAANDRAQLTFDAATTANSSMYYTYVYTII